MKALESITLADVEEFVPRFFSRLYVKAYVYGNLCASVGLSTDLLRSYFFPSCLMSRLVELDCIFCVLRLNRVVHVTGKNRSAVHSEPWRVK